MDGRGEEIQVILDNLKNTDPGVTQSALNMLVQKLRTSTSVASAIPKMLIYLISQKGALKDKLETLSGENRKIMADVLSVISATSDGIESLQYRMEGGATPLEIWGHQYIKKLSSDITKVHVENIEVKKEPMEMIMKEVLTSLFQFNSECEAIDLLIEVDRIEMAPNYIDRDNLDRACTYLYSIAPYLSREERAKVNGSLIEIHRKTGQVVEYTNLMVKERRFEELEQVLKTEPEEIQMQIAYVLSKHRVFLQAGSEKVQRIINGYHMKGINQYVSERLELNKIGKNRAVGGGSFPEALTKATFSEEKIQEQENKKSYKISSQGSKGLLYLYNSSKAIEELEENLFSEDGYLKVSSILALSASMCTMQDDNETVLALVRESFNTNSTTQKIVLLHSLALQYTGTCRKDVYDLVKESAHSEQIEISLFSMFVMGCIYAQSCNVEIFTEVLLVFSERISKSIFSKYAMLGVALIFLGGEDRIEQVAELVASVEEYGVALSILLNGISYFGTGNTKILHKVLKDALEEGTPNLSEEEEEEEAYLEYKHVFSILSVALISAGEETLVNMATHTLEGVMLLDIPRVQMAVPLALSILHMSSAKAEVIEVLKRSAHSGDPSVVVSSIGALGVVSAGSSNSRVQNALEQMEGFCGKGAAGSALKIAEGLLYLGKGMMKLSMFTGGIASPRKVSGMLGFIFALLDGGSFVLDKYYFILMLLTPSITPKYLVTVDSEGAPVKAQVRVGGKVDVSGVAGRPKRLSGSQVRETPVVLQLNEGAELIGGAKSFHMSEEIIVIGSDQAL